MDMLSTLRVRRRIMEVLEEHILPALPCPELVQVFAGLPLQLSHVEHWTVHDELLPDKNSPIELITCWDEQGVLRNQMPMLGFVFKGTSFERIGVTESMAAALPADDGPCPPGVTAYRLDAPAVFYVPARVPRNSISTPEQRQQLASLGPLGILCIDFLDKELLVRIYESDREGTHVLQLSDPGLVELGLEYAKCLPDGDQEISRSQLNALLRAITQSLVELPVTFANSSWPSISKRFASFDQATPHDREFCTKAILYIQTHLHSPLTRNVLAKEMGVSAIYLNQIFLRTTGVTVMRCVTLCRVEAAKLMLQFSHAERISEIAKLTGFANIYSFTSVFTRITGSSPTSYRRQFNSSPSKCDEPSSQKSQSTLVQIGGD